MWYSLRVEVARHVVLAVKDGLAAIHAIHHPHPLIGGFVIRHCGVLCVDRIAEVTSAWEISVEAVVWIESLNMEVRHVFNPIPGFFVTRSPFWSYYAPDQWITQRQFCAFAGE
jgi:hypothetical protein